MTHAGPFLLGFAAGIIAFSTPTFAAPAATVDIAQSNHNIVLVAQKRGSRTLGVTAVRYPGGKFRKVGPRKWVEGRGDGKFTFREIDDDGRAITLLDKSRGVYIFLNLRKEWVMYAEGDQPPRELYPIIGVEKDDPEEEVAVMPEMPELPKMARYTCEEGVPMVVRFENRGDRSLAFISIDGSPEMRLKQIPTGSGVKYSNGEYTILTKGRNAILEINGDTDICTGR